MSSKPKWFSSSRPKTYIIHHGELFPYILHLLLRFKCSKDLCFVSSLRFVPLLRIIVATVAERMKRSASEMLVGRVNIIKSVSTLLAVGGSARRLLLKACDSFSLQVGFHGQTSNVVGGLMEGAITLTATEKGKEREVKDRQAWRKEDGVQLETDTWRG